MPRYGGATIAGVRSRRGTINEAEEAINKFDAALVGDSRRTDRLIKDQQGRVTRTSPPVSSVSCP